MWVLTVILILESVRREAELDFKFSVCVEFINLITPNIEFNQTVVTQMSNLDFAPTLFVDVYSL